MSKLFYDNLVSLKELEKEINKIAKTKEEKEELWDLADELINHRVVGAILDELHKDHHEDFIVRLHEAPHDDGIFDYLKDKLTKDAKEFVKAEILSVSNELLEELSVQINQLAKKSTPKKKKTSKKKK